MNPWLVHLKTFHEAHPELTYKQAMSQAKLTYVKGGTIASRGTPTEKEAVREIYDFRKMTGTQDEPYGKKEKLLLRKMRKKLDKDLTLSASDAHGISNFEIYDTAVSPLGKYKLQGKLLKEKIGL